MYLNLNLINVFKFKLFYCLKKKLENDFLNAIYI